MREDDLLTLAISENATREQLTILSGDIKWSFRYAIRKALIMNPNTPRAIAAVQLKHLSVADLRKVYHHPETTVYLRRCIERLRAQKMIPRS